MGKQIKLSDEQYRVLAEVAGAHATTSEHVLGEVIEELARLSKDAKEDTTATSAARRLLLRMRGQRPPVLVDVTLPTIDPDGLIRALAQALHMTEPELRARTDVAPGNAFELEDWFRHLGMSEVDIAESARMARDNYPAEEPHSDAQPMADHADP